MNSLRLPPPRKHDNDSSEARDRIVQQTDQDASQSRLSAVETGYLQDPFAKEFVSAEITRRLPLINRGTYVRTTALDNLVTKFLFNPTSNTSSTQKKQIISLGAGSDTRYFRLLSQNPSLSTTLLYHELDFPSVTTSKINSILKSPSLKSLIFSPTLEINAAAGTMVSGGYRIHAIDLRSLSPGSLLLEGIDASLPTLFISECCLIYLSPAEADGILRWATSGFSGAVGIILYEPIGGEDAFGKVMVQNLAARGIVLRTLEKYSSLQRQRERLKVLGFVDEQQAVAVDFIFEKWVGEEERGRIARCEMLDEVEEWRLLAGHYCVAWGWRKGRVEAGGELEEREREGGFERWRGAFPT